MTKCPIKAACVHSRFNNIRIYHGREGRIEKKIRPEDHRLASGGLSSDD